MIITRAMPATTFSLVDATPSDYSFATDPSRLTDGRPARRCRIVNNGSGTGIQLLAERSGPASNFRVIAMLGLGEEFVGRDVTMILQTSIGGVSFNTFQARRLQDGTLAIIALVPESFDTTGPYIGVRFLLDIPGGGCEIGQIVIADALTYCITRDWTEGRDINSRLNTTPNGQPSRVARLSARTASVSIAPVSDTAAYGAGFTLQALQFDLDKYRPVLVIPAPRGIGRGEAAPIDEDFVYNTALFGYATNLGRLQLVAGSNLVQLSGLQFKEAPARSG